MNFRLTPRGRSATASVRKSARAPHFFTSRSLVCPSFVLLLAIAVAAPSCSSGPDPAAEAARQAKAAEDAAKAKAREEIVAVREVQRLAALWTYASVPADKGRQISASIFSTENVDTDGKGPNAVQLVFRDHPSWGRSSYLVLKAGDFACYGSCTVNVTVDAAAPKPMSGRRPKTDEAIAMFINDWRGLWRLTAGAKRLSIEFPVKAGGTRTASFDVVGLDRSKMPGWGTAPPAAAKD